MGEIVKGHVSSGYERVRELYERDFSRGSDVDSQLCVYVRGERVVDLWGSHGPKRDPNYGPDSMQVGPQAKCRVRQKLNFKVARTRPVVRGYFPQPWIPTSAVI